MALSLVNWNVEWATPRSRKTAEILSRIDRHSPDIVCLTETHTDLLSRDGYTICARPDYGYPITEGRRKVILWSREPWERVDDVGTDSLPPGRFVSGVTRISAGEVTVIGVCIPWFGSRTEARRGSKRRMRWEDHEEYLSSLSGVLARTASERLIVMGDFNQRIRQGADTPPNLYEALRSALPPRMTIATSALGLNGRRSIDHIVLSEGLAAESIGVISNLDGGRTLSDHFGVFAHISARAS